MAKAAGYTIVALIKQIRNADSSFQIGIGKAKELADIVKKLKAERVIFDNELKSIQSYNLAKLTGVKIIDRFQLILEIFSKRASTKEAQLQIRLANLQRRLPRAKEMVRLAKLGEHPGFLGLGRHEVDVYHEDIKRQIGRIQRELKKIRKQRNLHRTRRTELGFPIITLAGYTNTGKTTLFNVLTGESKPVNLGLFTTLSTWTRSIYLKGGKALLTDTVGFIDRLPLVLVEAFHSTLEETILSDAIILVIDIHEPLEEIKKKLRCSLNTIKEIGAAGIPIVTALNKIDLLTQKDRLKKKSYVKNLAPNPILISALEGKNLEELKDKVEELLGDITTILFELPLTEKTLSFISDLYNKTNSIDVVYQNKKIFGKLSVFLWHINTITFQVKNLNGKILEPHHLKSTLFN